MPSSSRCPSDGSSEGGRAKPSPGANPAGTHLHERSQRSCVTTHFPLVSQHSAFSPLLSPLTAGLSLAEQAHTFCFSCSTVCFIWWSSLHVAQQVPASTAFSDFSPCPARGDGLGWVGEAGGRPDPRKTASQLAVPGGPADSGTCEGGRRFYGSQVTDHTPGSGERWRQPLPPAPHPHPGPQCSVFSCSHSGTPGSSSFMCEHGNHGPFVSAS